MKILSAYIFFVLAFGIVWAKPNFYSDGGQPHYHSSLGAALSTDSTYLAEVLKAHNDSIFRWPDSSLISIWIQPVSDSTRAHWPTIAREAFSNWQECGISIVFSSAKDSASASIRVTWRDRFLEPVSGKAFWSHDDRGFIVASDISIALHHDDGLRLDENSTRAITTHEVGHSIGLEHTIDSVSVMRAVVKVPSTSRIDCLTVQEIYKLSPGPLRAN